MMDHGQQIDLPWPEWPSPDSSTEEIMRSVLYSGRWAISGNSSGNSTFEQRFSQAFARYHNVQYCIPCSNGSSGLVIALEALGVGFGDEVLVPALTWVACASAVLRVGAIPKIVDIDPQNLCMSLDEAKRAISPQTKAIILVHAYCCIADITGFLNLSQIHSLPIIEDCSQAHGAIYENKKVGTFGKVGVFSFQQTKILTSGEGGAVITSDRDIALKLEQLRSDGRRYEGSELVEAGNIQGYNYCISEFQAAILIDGLAKLDSQNELRKSNGLLLNELLSGNNRISTFLKCSSNASPSIYDYCILFDCVEEDTLDIANTISRELNTRVNPSHTPIHKSALYVPSKSNRGPSQTKQSIATSELNLPVAESIAQRMIRLPHHLFLGNEEHMHLISKVISNHGC